MQVAPDLKSHLARGVVSSCRVFAPKPRRMVPMSSIYSNNNLQSVLPEYLSEVSGGANYDWVQPQYVQVPACLPSSPISPNNNSNMGQSTRCNNPDPSYFESSYENNLFIPLNNYKNVNVPQFCLSRVSCSI